MANKSKGEWLQFRFYEMPQGEPILALLGEDWIRPYGKGIPELHFHNYMEIGICHEGRGTMIIEDSEYSFKPGDIAIIPANMPHNTISQDFELGFWEWLYVDIPLALQSISQLAAHTMNVKELERLINQEGQFFHKTERPILAQIIYQIRQECECRDYLYRESIWVLLQAFVIELLRTKDLKEENLKKDKINLAISPAINYAEEHYQEPIRMENLAEACGLSESHFRRLFRESMNMSPQEYVAMIRIKRACDLIEKTDKSMGQIAYETGFASVSSFNRNFKKLMETSPFRWKQSVKEKDGIPRNIKVKALKGW